MVDRSCHRVSSAKAAKRDEMLLTLELTKMKDGPDGRQLVLEARSTLDSLVLSPVHVDGKRDTVSGLVGPERLPDWCASDPALVAVRLMLARSGH